MASRYYHCESYGGWFVCYADSMADARKCTKEEFGDVKEVRRATPTEVEEYVKLKGIDTYNSNTIYYAIEKERIEKNRQFQMRYYDVNK